MGGTRPIVLVIRDQGRNPEDFSEPTRSHLIVLDVQDQGQISEGFIEPTQNHLR